MFLDKDGNHIVGFCLWCGKDFYSMEEVDKHNDNDMVECAEFHRLKDCVPMSQGSEGRICMPPVLQALFDEAELTDRGNKE